MTHAEHPDAACQTQVRTVRCTLPAGHDGPHAMHRDLAVKWWGAKSTHRWDVV